ncbi:adaptor protein MecA [[Clostridium] fimetarium]|uniref:Adapter protein MecA 1/2 n=1 Tax=[Clostridium] fimetarium TaxID=99656 RepID=A0A1I0M2C4_9FIRM|nr:adaptor protein MecA [[Clostridium] fimetarium]SEV81916.1 adapter protein MecA 1/2 [[Clostridium] fimetarium]
MKIEKLSDNQIRCTLNKSDLASRELKISELAYGSEKAKDLFRDMMQQASYELGFEAEDIPLMIEAIPVSTDCIILVITKVEDPEELDTRFSKFAPDISDDEDEDMDFSYENDSLDMIDHQTEPDNRADDVINLFSKVKDYLNSNVDDIIEIPKNKTDNFIPFNKSLKNSAINSTPKDFNTTPNTLSDTTSKDTNDSTKESEVNVIRIFQFDDLNIINNAANIISSIYSGDNSLYKDVKNNIYYLVIEKSDCSPTEFNKVCNILSEYGNKIHFSYASHAFIEEHCETIIKSNAIQILANL